MKRITIEMLKEANACASQVRVFEKVFPRGAPVSMTSMRKAIKAGLEISFAARLLFPSERMAYDEDVALAGRAYDKATTLARKVYDKAITLAWRAYDEDVALAGIAYDEDVALILVAALAEEKP